ncbi:MAG: toxin HicA [Nostocales cyanobacterium]|nr:MAG: toxin HicA [Nostocales cyanobacterium]TAF18407.1 MAG: toxin HicA [Nostocales cyanobacterium]
MKQIEKILSQIKNNPKDVNFNDLVKVCNHYFGEPRQKGTSHCVYKTPWFGDPRVNIQSKDGKAKVYQVKQVLAAIEKLEETEND